MSKVCVDSDCTCGKCKVPIEAICTQEPDGTLVVEDLVAGSCWFCDAAICPTCFENGGHCGHREADIITYAMRYMPVYRRVQLTSMLRRGERAYSVWN